MVAYGTRNAIVDPMVTVPNEDGRVEIRGEILDRLTGVEGLVNQGRFGVATCDARDDVKLPQFHLSCPVDSEDDQARLTVAYSQPERLLQRSAFSMLVWPGGRTTDTYRVPRYVGEHPMLSSEKANEDFVYLLNDVRRQAGLAPLELDARQSEVANELAPHFISSIFERSSPVVADLVVLGMMAGWYVDGIVESGDFASSWVLRTNDLGRLLSMALERPTSRDTLLDPDARRIAVGTLVDVEQGQESMAAIFGTYSLFSTEQHDALAKQVVEKVESERRARGYAPAELLDDLAGACRLAAAQVHAGADTSDAMNGLLRLSAGILKRPVSGWIAEVRDIDDLQIPVEYVSRPELGLAVSVTHKREEGEPWGRYVVMLVVADPAGFGT
jgi:hypothetical protein